MRQTGGRRKPGQTPPRYRAQKCRRPVGLGSPQLDPGADLLRGEFPSVPEQILQRDAHEPRVCFGPKPRSNDELRIPLGLSSPEFGGNRAPELRQVHRLSAHFRPGDSREIEEVVDQRAHPLRPRSGALQILFSLIVEPVGVVLKQGLAEAVDGPQRRAQIMRHRVGERLEFLVGGFELCAPPENIVFGALALLHLVVDGEAGRKEEEESQRVSENDHRLHFSGAGRGGRQPRCQQALFLLPHLADLCANLIHDLFARVCLNRRDGSRHPLPATDGDGVLQLRQFLGDQRIKLPQRAHVAGIIRSRRAELFDVPMNPALRVRIRLQVGFPSRDDVAPLAGLGVSQIGQDGAELFEDPVAVLHPLLILVLTNHPQIGEHSHADQNGQRRPKSARKLSSERHGTANNERRRTITPPKFRSVVLRSFGRNSILIQAGEQSSAAAPLCPDSQGAHGRKKERASHRDPRLCQNPDGFGTERWRDVRIRSRRLPRFAYFPFAGVLGVRGDVMVRRRQCCFSQPSRNDSISPSSPTGVSKSFVAFFVPSTKRGVQAWFSRGANSGCCPFPPSSENGRWNRASDP
jgi:hypothetical protein